MGHDLKTLAIVQARMGSTRFPNEVMLPINGVPLIELLLHRLSLAKLIDHILVATSTATGDKQLAAHVRNLGYEVFEGSENNVLYRFYKAALPHRPNTVVRITGDCPLLDPELVDVIIASFDARHVDYLCNGNPSTFPDGLDTEVFTYSALEQAARHANTSDSLSTLPPTSVKAVALQQKIFSTTTTIPASVGQWTNQRTSQSLMQFLDILVRELILVSWR